MASKAIGFLNFKFGADLSGFERAMNKAQKKLKKFGKNIQKTGKSLTTGLTLPIVALGAASLKTFADFEQSMLKVKAISGATESDFKALTDSAKELGSSTMFTATQVSELQLNLSKLGLTPKEINKSTQAILNLAQATDSDLGQAATVGASTMNAFGLEAQDMTMIADVMADAFSSTALDLEKFQTAMASVAPVAAQAGQDIQGTSAILGVLVNNGIEASSAGTALRNVFLELSNQGITWDQAMKKIQGSMNPLKTAMDLFGKRGASVATIIANNGIEIKSLTEDFRDSSGEAQAMADIMDSGVAGSMRRMQSQLEGVAIELGEQLIPVFNTLIGYLESGVKWFSSLSNSQKENLVKWGLMLAAIGPVLIIIGKMSVGISALIPIVKTLTATLAANPWLILAAAIALAGKAVYDYTTTLHGAEKAKRDLLDIEVDAVANAKNEERLLLQKLEVARDVTKSDKERKGAIVELNNKLVGLNKTLNLENIAETNVTNAINEHTKALINQAKIAGIQELITENFKEMQKVALDGSRAVGDMFSIQGVLDVGKHFTTTLGGILSGEGISESSKKGGKAIVDGYVDGLKEEESHLQTALNELLDQAPSLPDITPDLGDTGVTMSNLTKTTDELTDSTKQYSDALEDNIKLGDDQFQQYSLVEDQFKGMVTWTTRLTDAQKLLSGGAALFGDVLSSSLNSALDSQENFFTIFIKNIKRAIASLLIELAIMTMIDILLGGKNFSKALITGNAMKVMNIPMAEGGLVTGPTTALIGEGPGTTTANPEVVAPLDKLKSMIGGGNQNITVTGKLIGNDIFLSNAKTGVDRLRTV